MRTTILVVLLAGGSALAAAAELHVQCPPGTGAVLQGDAVRCEPLQPASVPPSGGPNRLKTTPRPAEPAPPPPLPAPADPVALELSGLHGVPDLCGLNTQPERVVEQAAEAIHVAVGECASDVGAESSAPPTRWLVFRVDALSETAHELTSPRTEPWAAVLDACLARRKLRLPKAVRGHSFSAWYLVATDAQATPPSPLCGVAKER